MDPEHDTASGIEVIPTGKALGAEVRGVDLAHAPAGETLRAVRDAWAEHLVLLFRGQDLTPEQHIAFTATLGEPDPWGGDTTEFARKYPEILEVTNVGPDGEPVYTGLSNHEALWHTDMTYREIPPSGCALYAREVAPEGGHTSFLNMYRAYETLPADLRERIRDLKIIHDASRNSAGVLRKGFTEISNPRDTPGPRHPIVRTHPVTGRKCLFLGRRAWSYVPGLGPEESEALLDALWAHTTREEFVWTHDDWRVGDLVLWDNRCTMHHRTAFEMKHRRVLHRTQIKGEPVY